MKIVFDNLFGKCSQRKVLHCECWSLPDKSFSNRPYLSPFYSLLLL